MVPIWIGRMVAKGIIKGVKHRIDLKKIDKYVNKPNELDLQIRAHAKELDKLGRYVEELEKEVAILKADSHPPIFAKKNYKDILKRLNKLEKRR